MILTVKEVEHIGQLAKLHLSEEEKAQYAEQLTAVFGFIEVLGEVDTDGVPETSQVTGLEDVVREDIVVSSSGQMLGQLIDAFPERARDELKVRAVFS